MQISAYESMHQPQEITLPLPGNPCLTVNPKIANPNIMNSGLQVIKYLKENPELIENKTIIDMGTGCGIIGIAAALLGAKKVIMADIDPKAVENTALNIARLNTQKTCHVFLSDLFEKFSDQKADFHIFNHPFFAGKPIKNKPWTRMMLSTPELIQRYLQQAPQYATDEAKYLMPWLDLAGNKNQPDNDPRKLSTSFGFAIKDVQAQKAVEHGIQRTDFSIFLMEKTL